MVHIVSIVFSLSQSVEAVACIVKTHTLNNMTIIMTVERDFKMPKKSQISQDLF